MCSKSLITWFGVFTPNRKGSYLWGARGTGSERKMEGNFNIIFKVLFLFIKKMRAKENMTNANICSF